MGTLGYNLLVLTCSLKKALSTGIRLSWQGQLRLALPISRNVSIKLLPVLQSPCCLLSRVNDFSHTGITKPIEIKYICRYQIFMGLVGLEQRKHTLLSRIKANKNVNQMV